MPDSHTHVFTLLYRRYRQHLFQYSYTITESKAASEDVVQEVFIKLWINRDKLNEVEDMASYLFTMSRNLAITQMRRQKKERVVLKEYSKELTNSYAVDDYGGKELEKVIHAAIEQLPERQRLIYTLRKEEGWRRDEIANRLEISECTVKVTIQNANKKLRKFVGEKLELEC